MLHAGGQSKARIWPYHFGHVIKLSFI
jgi:hypothetical protein